MDKEQALAKIQHARGTKDLSVVSIYRLLRRLFLDSDLIYWSADKDNVVDEILALLEEWRGNE